MLKKLLGLLSDAAVYGATSVLSQVISFCLLPLYTSYLTPRDYGIVAMLNIISVIYQPLANLGISNAIFRRFNRCKDEDERRTVLGTGLVGIATSSLILLSVAGFFWNPLGKLLLGEGTGDHNVLVLLTLGTGFITSINAVPQTVLRAQRRVKTIGVLTILEVSTTILTTVFLVAVLEWGVLGVIAGSMAGEVIFGVVLAASTFRDLVPKLDRSILRSMLSYGLPLVPHQLQIVGLAYVSQYMLRELAGLRDAGLFNMAQKFALPVALVVNAIQRAWVPYKFQIHAEDEDPRAFFRTAVTYYVAGTAYLWLGVSLWGPELLRVMTTDSFHEAALLVPAAALIPLSGGLRSMFSTGRELTDNTGPLPLVAFFGLVAVVVAGLLLIPRFGAMGAAFATSIGWIVQAIGGYWLAQRAFRIDYQWSLIAGFLVLSAGLVVIFYSANHSSTPLRLATAVGISVAYPAIAALLLYRSPVERGRMLSIWSRIVARSRGGHVDRPARS